MVRLPVVSSIAIPLLVAIPGVDEIARRLLDQSRCSYFMKPFNLERLTAAVDMLTGMRSPDTIG